MTNLTPAQQERLNKQKGRGTHAAQIASGHAIDPVSIQVMLDQGVPVVIGNKEYEIAEFPMRLLPKVGPLINQCPEQMVIHAMAADKGELNIQKTLDMLNRMNAKAAIKEDPEAKPVPMTLEELEAALGYTLATSITEEQVEAMEQLTLLAIRKCHPNVTIEDFADDLYPDVCQNVLHAIFQANPALRSRF